MQIQVIHKTVYGNELFYPANPLAQTLVEWKSAKSFTNADLAFLNKRGFSIECVNVPSYSKEAA